MFAPNELINDLNTLSTLVARLGHAAVRINNNIKRLIALPVRPPSSLAQYNTIGRSSRASRD